MHSRPAPVGIPKEAGPAPSWPAPQGAHQQGWRWDALCAQTDPEAFFPEKGQSPAAAKRVCRACPVRLPCLAFALAANERHGVWGGLSEQERQRVRRRGLSRASSPAVACPEVRAGAVAS
ncbi:MAG: WhiB family transcriptional regulator [Kineosporiaceae bacterium]